MTKELKIVNVGPIKEIHINLNKVNVFMGQQGSGKSTLAKIISFCSWIEKDISIHQSFEKYEEQNYFQEKLETFHKMKGYLSSSSEIVYKGDAIQLYFKGGKCSVEWLSTRFEYKKCKISYIPAERSMVILPEMEKVEFPNNYLKSFLFDWFDARKNYPKNKEFNLLDLGIKFYFVEETKENHISGSGSVGAGYDILLSQASSGLQSLTPLLTMVDNLINHIYNVDKKASYDLDEVKLKVSRLLLQKFILEPYYGDSVIKSSSIEKLIEELNHVLLGENEGIMPHFRKYTDVRNNLFRTHRSNLIIEEPEQNLFPSTQKQLVYSLLKQINSSPDHTLSLTTHSPYVLYALNNCIMYSLVRDKMSASNEQFSLACKESVIDSKMISIYEIQGGMLTSIQEDNGLIGRNFFDGQMTEVMDEFYTMLNFL